MEIIKSEYKVEDLLKLLCYSEKQYNNKPAVKYIQDKKIFEKSYSELKKDSFNIAGYFDKNGYKDKKIAIISPNSYNWVVTFLGITISENIAVPIDSQKSVFDMVLIMEKMDIELVMYGKDAIKSVTYIKKSSKNIKEFICLDQVYGNKDLTIQNILDYQFGNNYLPSVDKMKCCAIYLTSGTTGKSKGVMLNHVNLLSVPVLEEVGTEHAQALMSVLPSNHIYCITADILHSLYTGLPICINDSIVNFFNNAVLFKPSIITLVPMLLDYICNKLQNLSKKNPAATKRECVNMLLGENMDILITGGAYVNPKLIKTLNTYGIKVIYGYGMTECLCISRSLAPNKDDIGCKSVGEIVDTCTAKTVDNEIFVRGNGVMMGYYNDWEETAKAMTDGWFKTGDLGYIENNYLYLTGRKKNLIILSSGENISPEKIENQLLNKKIIKEAVVNSENDILVAEVYPDPSYTLQKDTAAVKSKVMEIIKDINKNNALYEQIHKIVIRDTEFEKTTSKKIIRANGGK